MMELLERDTFLAALERRLRDAHAGEGTLVLVAGEAGVGKTSLLRSFVDDRSDTRVLWAACDGLFTPRPLGPLADLAEQTGGPIARALADGSSRTELFTTVLDELRSTPTVAVVEDLHWADEATLDLIRFLARRIGGTQTLLVGTYRDDEVGARHPLRIVLGDTVSFERVERLSLPPLSRAGVETLAAGSGVDPVELHGSTGGNPFFVTEVLAAPGSAIPTTVRDAVLARAGRLGPEARHVLDAASVIGARVELDLLELVLGRSPSALDECVTTGVLHTNRDGAGFRHELARVSIEEAIEPARRLEFHRQALRALAAHSPDADSARLAYHAEAIGDRELVLRHSIPAAERAAELGAHREAAAQYARALRFAEGLPQRARAELLERRSFECYLTLQIEEGLAAAEAALEEYRGLGDRAREGDMLRSVARLSYLAGRATHAREAARSAVAILERLPAGRELAMAQAHMAQHASSDLDLERAVAWGERAIALAEKLGECDIVVHALTTVGLTDAIAGRKGERLERALSLALEAGSDDDVARAYGALGFAAVRRFDWKAADRWLEEGLRYSTDRDLESWRTYLLGWRGIAALARGRWDDAAEDARAGLNNPRALLSRAWCLLVLGALRARRGDPEVWPVLDEVQELVREDPPQKLAHLEVARAEAAFLAGDSNRARAELGSVPLAAFVDRLAAGRLALWRRRLGVPAEETGPLAKQFALELEGKPAEAAARWDELGCPYESALALAGSDDEQLLRRSHDTLVALGAMPAAGIVARRLRAVGARGLTRGPRAATRADPAGLTRREQEVLELVADGMRNSEIAARLFITEKTVGHHVSSILRKLGVQSRYEAAQVARAQDRERAGQT